jgi:hypothetical protein
VTVAGFDRYRIAVVQQMLGREHIGADDNVYVIAGRPTRASSHQRATMASDCG